MKYSDDIEYPDGDVLKYYKDKFTDLRKMGRGAQAGKIVGDYVDSQRDYGSHMDDNPISNVIGGLQRRSTTKNIINQSQNNIILKLE